MPQSREGRSFCTSPFALASSVFPYLSPDHFPPFEGKTFLDPLGSINRVEKKKKGKNSRKARPLTLNGTMHPLVPIYELQKRLRPRFRAKFELDRGRIFETTGSNCPEGNCINCNCQSLFVGARDTRVSNKLTTLRRDTIFTGLRIG